MSGEHQIGDGPVSPEYIAMMKGVAQAIDGLFNGEDAGEERKIGFVLMVFEFGEIEAGRVNYISNAGSRADIVALLKHQIARFEGQPDVVGHG